MVRRRAARGASAPGAALVCSAGPGLPRMKFFALLTTAQNVIPARVSFSPSLGSGAREESRIPVPQRAKRPGFSARQPRARMTQQRIRRAELEDENGWLPRSSPRMLRAVPFLLRALLVEGRSFLPRPRCSRERIKVRVQHCHPRLRTQRATLRKTRAQDRYVIPAALRLSARRTARDPSPAEGPLASLRAPKRRLRMTAFVARRARRARRGNAPSDCRTGRST
jgi:hypothetical protein